MKKIIAAIVAVMLVLLGLLWFLQGADILHIWPILCFAGCEYISDGSWVWEIVGFFSFALGIAVLTASQIPLTTPSAILRRIRDWPLGAAETAVIATPTFYFLLVFALSIPFYLLGISGARMPGLSFLPASSVMTFVPMIAAMILIYRQLGINGVNALARRAFDFNRTINARWILMALLFVPFVCSLELVILRSIGVPLPSPQIAPSAASLAFIAFFIGAIGEELGWQGYAYPALRKKHSALAAAVVLGVIWALWHLIPYAQMGHDTIWIFWHLLCTVALRILIVSLYENTNQSVFIAVLFHTMLNLSWVLFPTSSAYYHPLVTFWILAVAVGLNVFIYGPKTLKQTASSA
ncbi:MAG: type II CAAX endopeptidase family protein [Aestuariivirga sp.]